MRERIEKIHHGGFRNMKITRKHLKVFYLYEGKLESLNKVGSKKEKSLFQEGEFEIINGLIKVDSLARNGKLSNKELIDYKDNLNSLNLSWFNKKSISALSKKIYDKDHKIKESNTFMGILELLVDILKGIFS